MQQQLSSYSQLICGQQNLPKKPLEKLMARETWNDESFKRMIRKIGIKVTQQRLAILKSLTRGPVHVTAQEVYEVVKPLHQDMGFATVYRFLRKLVECGFVTEVRMGGLPARYELTTHQHHDHLTCERCGKIVEFENLEIENLQVTVAKQYGFRLTHHLLELYGLCPQCQKK